MTRTRRRRIRACSLLAAISIVLAGCSNSDDESDDTTASAETDVSDTGAADDEPAETADTAATDGDPADTEPAGTEPVDTEPADTATADTEPADTEPVDTEPATTEPEIGEFQAIEGVPGVTDDRIQFAVLGTGPSNPLGYCLLECYAGGVQAYFDWRNSIGGVHGRELVKFDVDDQVANTQIEFLELSGNDDVFAVFAAPLTPIGFPDAADAGLPVYTTAPSAPAGVGYDSVFAPNLWCQECPAPTSVHVAQVAGATRVASLGFGISQASKDCVNYTRSTFETYGPEVGIEFVYSNDELAFGLPNGLGPEVTAMIDAGVDFITTCIDQNSILTLEQELERQGAGDITVVLPQGYGDSEYIGANADLLEGDILGTAFRPFEADPGNSRIEIMQEFLEAGGYKLNDYFINGWISADMAVTGLLAAGPQFDRVAVIDATNAITDYTAGGLISSIDFSKWHTPYTIDTMLSDGPAEGCTVVVRVVDGGFELVGDPATPWACLPRIPDGWVDAEYRDFG